MTDLADAFIALPGGIGTLDELFEAWSWNALGYHAKPFCLLNVAGFWDGLIEFMDHATESGFLSASRRSQLLVAAHSGRSAGIAGRSRWHALRKAWSGKPGGGARH